MPLRKNASGHIRPGYDPIKVPDAPTIGTATGGDAQATVPFTAPGNVGGSAISGYGAVSNTGISSTGSSSPITVTGLTNGVAYTSFNTLLLHLQVILLILEIFQQQILIWADVLIAQEGFNNA